MLETPDGASVAARTQDLSATGICVTAAQSCNPGDRVGFELRLILDQAESNTLTLPGVVVWCVKVRGGFQIGARFLLDALNRSEQEQLEILLRVLEGEIDLPSTGAAS